MIIKKIIYFASWLIALACIGVPAQSYWQSRNSNYNQTVGGFSTSCSQSANFLARATLVTNNTDKTNYDTLICGLETDGVGCSTTLDVLQIWGAPDSTTALLNLCSATYGGVTSGTVSFAANIGFTGNGSDFYIDASFVPSTAPSPKFVQDSASFGVAIQSTGNGGTTYAMGSATGNGAYFSPNDSGTMSTAINGPLFQPLNANQQGLWGITRTAVSGAGSSAVYRNGFTTPFATDTQASTGVPGFSMVMFVLNIPTPFLFYSGQMSATWIGAGLSAANYKKLSDRINTFMTAYTHGLY